MNTTTEHLPTDETRAALSAALVNRDRLLEAVARATARAAEAELARADAEERHANVVADALLDDKPTPAKPAALSAVQAADDSADAALELLNRRLLAAEGMAHGASTAHVDATLEIIISDQVKAGTDALSRLVQAASGLNSARGTNHLRSALELVGLHNWTDGLGLSAVRTLASEVPMIPSVIGLYEVRIAESVRPLSPQTITAILTEKK